MKGCPPYGHTTHHNGFKVGDRGQGAGASYLDFYFLNPGRLLGGLEFEGKRPPWTP